MDNYRVKSLEGGGGVIWTGACICLRREEVRLELHELLTPKLLARNLLA
jgi:hypothetical protein